MTSKINNYQQQFIDCLLSSEQEVSEEIFMGNRASLDIRFSVYRNNVIFGLINALEDKFPVCLRLLGTDYFRQLAKEYVIDNLPNSPVVFEYGESFSKFILSNAVIKHLPYLADVAKLEYSIGEAYHAPNAPIVSLPDFEKIGASRLFDSQVTLHPSVACFHSNYPIVDIWKTNTHDREVKSITLLNAEDILVSRPSFEIIIESLPVGAVSFIKQLSDGKLMSEAVAFVNDMNKNFDLTKCLQIMMKSGVIANIKSCGQEEVSR
jgi:hypothetical protein